jgi:F-type H+-transporting ATPase subunit epsilon
MAMQVELVSPEKKLASLEADVVGLPGSDGDFAAMPGHVPTATSLRPGVVSIKSGSDTTEYLVAGGFAEITAESVSILAEYAAIRSEATSDMFDSVRAAAQAKVDATKGMRKAEAERDLMEIDGLMKALTL